MSTFETILQVGRAFGVLDGMLRMEYELERGSGLMSWKMRSVHGWDSWNLARIAPDNSAEEILAGRRDGTCRFFFDNVQALTAGIKEILGADGEQSLLAEANSILSGNLPFFGGLQFVCGFPPQWFRNPVTGHSVSPHQNWTQMRFASPVYGDLKFILEPSRFLFVYPLARAYAISGDERFPEAFWNTIEDWAQKSPPMSGPLWICGQECSLRIIAWSFALHAFICSPSTTSERAALLISMIAAHAWRTSQTLGYARSQRSNHLISEAVGLWTAGTLYPELREAQVWQNLGADLLHDAVLDQIAPEGVSQQHSFNYQRMILHLLLWTLRLAEIHNAPLHESIRSRAQAAFDFMRAWVDPVSGLVPNYGSDDGSLILPLAPGSHHDYRPLLQLGAAILDRPSLKSGPWDEVPAWFGVGSKDKEKAISDRLPPVDTGYFRLGNETSWAMIRAGRYSRRPFQCDQLHVDLWWQGNNLARDAGTYLYNGAPPWNNGFAGTSIHNTVMVDHRDQMRRAGRFLWVDWAQASGRLFSSPGGASDRFEGEHDGYRNYGVKHRRTVQWLSGAGWIIVDDLEGTSEHDVRLHWLVPDMPYAASDLPFRVTLTAKSAQIRWSIFSNTPGDAALIRAGRQQNIFGKKNASPESTLQGAQWLGWEAPTYGHLQPALSLVYETRSLLPLRIVTVVLTDERCKLCSQEGQIVITRDLFDRNRNETEVYRMNLAMEHVAELEAPPVGDPKA